MGDKQYYNGSYCSYGKFECQMQNQENIHNPTQQNQLFPYMAFNNAYQSSNFMQMYPMGNLNHCKSIRGYGDQTDAIGTFWDGRILSDVDKHLKMPEKVDLVQITSKDLSPAASYCSNELSDLSKMKDWYSCAIEQNKNDSDKYSYSCDLLSENHQYYTYPSYETGAQYYNQNQFQSTLEVFDPITSLEQQTEDDESDIVVEDTDEEITDYSEDLEGKNRCSICNVSYTPAGVQFYHLTTESPLTMSTQRPVLSEIKSLLKSSFLGRNFICNSCLGLVNSIDHLKVKLDGFNKELKMKFKETCDTNKTKLVKKKKSVISYKCRKCKKILSIKKYIQLHIKLHKRKKWLCEVCGMLFLNLKKFKLHIAKHNDSKMCQNCQRSFKSIPKLKEHQHYCLSLYPFKCPKPHCDKKFATSTKLRNHTKLKHDKKFVAICSICNIGFVKLSDYKSHMVSHSTDKKFQCNKCDKSYKTLSNLNFHLKSHSRKLPFICSECGKGFMRKEYWEAHLNKHNGVKNFICNICDKKFVAQKNLDSHMKYHDGSLKWKTCNICGKSFTTGFEEHLRIHNNLREFGCDVCNLKFNTKGTLAKHKKRKHGAT